jgi:hypothetical protein
MTRSDPSIARDTPASRWGLASNAFEASAAFVLTTEVAGVHEAIQASTQACAACRSTLPTLNPIEFVYSHAQHF